MERKRKREKTCTIGNQSTTFPLEGREEEKRYKILSFHWTEQEEKRMYKKEIKKNMGGGGGERKRKNGWKILKEKR